MTKGAVAVGLADAVAVLEMELVADTEEVMDTELVAELVWEGEEEMVMPASSEEVGVLVMETLEEGVWLEEGVCEEDGVPVLVLDGEAVLEGVLDGVAVLVGV